MTKKDIEKWTDEELLKFLTVHKIKEIKLVGLEIEKRWNFDLYEFHEYMDNNN